MGNWRFELRFLENQKNDSMCVIPHLENKADIPDPARYIVKPVGER